MRLLWKIAINSIRWQVRHTTKKFVYEVSFDKSFVEALNKIDFALTLTEKPCGKMWTFERIIGFTLDEPADKEIKSIMLRTACQDLCLAERNFPCRSITFDYGRRICRLFRDTRRSKPNSFKMTSEFVDYMENKCATGKCSFSCWPDTVTLNITFYYFQNCPHVSIETLKIVTLPLLTELWLPPRLLTANGNVIPSNRSTASRSTLTQSVESALCPVRIQWPF